MLDFIAFSFQVQYLKQSVFYRVLENRVYINLYKAIWS